MFENHYGGGEDELVKKFIKLFGESERGSIFGMYYADPIFYEQIAVKSIGRISDLIIEIKSKKRYINIEFKLMDTEHVLKQAIDHSNWCDYSYICMPANFVRLARKDWISRVSSYGIGLVVFVKDTFIEIIPATYNTYKTKNKTIRNEVINEIKRKSRRNLDDN